MIDHSSASRFSIGVPVSATRCPARSCRTALAARDRLFFTACASSSTTRFHSKRPAADVAGGRGVRADDQVGVLEEFTQRVAVQPRTAVVRVHPQAGRELRRLPLPVADQ